MASHVVVHNHAGYALAGFGVSVPELVLAARVGAGLGCAVVDKCVVVAGAVSVCAVVKLVSLWAQCNASVNSRVVSFSEDVADAVLVDWTLCVECHLCS